MKAKQTANCKECDSYCKNECGGVETCCKKKCGQCGDNDNEEVWEVYQAWETRSVEKTLRVPVTKEVPCEVETPMCVPYKEYEDIPHTIMEDVEETYYVNVQKEEWIEVPDIEPFPVTFRECRDSYCNVVDDPAAPRIPR